MTRILKKAIMVKSRLKKPFSKHRANENKRNQNNEMNPSVSLRKKEKRK